MKNWLKLCLLFGIVIFYVISINIFANVISYSYVPPNTIGKILGADLEISIGESMSIQVIRAKKWWGRVLEDNGNSYLHIFELVMIPKKIKNYNFIWFHFIFIVTVILLTILMFSKKNYKGGEKNEKLYEDSNNTTNLVSGYDT